MNKNNDKISIRQVFILFVITTLSPGIRAFTNFTAEVAEKASWLTPFAAVVSYVVLYSVLNYFFKKKNFNNLNDVFETTLGKIASKILLSMYLFLSILLLCIYVRYYAARFTSTIYAHANIKFFILTMLLFVYYASRGKVQTLARFSEIMFLLFTFILVLLCVFLFPQVKLNNIYPITHYDFFPVVRASSIISAIWGYIFLPFFFGEKIQNKKQIKNFGKQSAIYLVAITSLILITVTGSLGYSVAQRMSHAFFNAVKLITFVESYDRFEPLVLAIWISADFVLITFFTIVSMTIIKNLFSLSELKYLATPVVSFSYIGSQYLAVNLFELQLLSINFARYMNLIFLYIVPILVFIIGKIRRKI